MLIPKLVTIVGLGRTKITPHSPGIHVPFKAMNEENFGQAVARVLKDPTFQEESERVGSLLNDQIEPPLERAIWWLEFLIRHPDYKLNSPIHQMSWLELNQIDVAAVILAVLILISTVLFFILRCCLTCWKGHKKNKPKDE